jgi:DNA modification methylase
MASNLQPSLASATPRSQNDSVLLAIVYRPVEQLKLGADNPRLHSKKQIAQIAESIRIFGFLIPVLTDGESRVICGHGRVQAAEVAGIRELPTVSVEHLTEHQIKAFRIADNKLAMNSQWDEKLLGEQLKILSEVDLEFDVETVGFETGEIDVIIEGLAPTIDADNDPADAAPQAKGSVAVTRGGDLWSLGPHRVYCGNSLNEDSFFKLMGNLRAALVFTDPPYNVAINRVTGLGAIQHPNFAMAAGELSVAQFTNFLAQACSLLAKYSIGGSMHYLFMDWKHMSEILEAGRKVYSELKALCVWTKDNGGMGSLYRSQHELVFVFKNGKDSHRNNVQLGQYGRYRTNVWSYPGVNSFARTTEEGNLLELHPTVKPVALVADAIMDCSSRNDIILDSFLGSGTTIIAAERTGRVCHGIEIDAGYVDTAIRRWQTFTGKTATHSISGRSFAELEQEATSGLSR